MIMFCLFHVISTNKSVVTESSTVVAWVAGGVEGGGWAGITKEHEKTLGNAGYMHHFNSGGRLWVCSYAKS